GVGHPDRAGRRISPRDREGGKSFSEPARYRQRLGESASRLVGAPFCRRGPSTLERLVDPFAPLARTLNEQRVRYVVIGVWGANYWAHAPSAVFTTGDQDLFLPLDAD